MEENPFGDTCTDKNKIRWRKLLQHQNITCIINSHMLCYSIWIWIRNQLPVPWPMALLFDIKTLKITNSEWNWLFWLVSLTHLKLNKIEKKTNLITYTGSKRFPDHHFIVKRGQKGARGALGFIQENHSASEAVGVMRCLDKRQALLDAKENKMGLILKRI